MTNSNTSIQRNSVRAWILASRPKTLTGAAAPVIVALALAWSDASTLHADYNHFEYIPAILCLLFALLMQVNANFINDYYDCKDGIDGEERLGPERACQQGWISMPAMKKGIWITSIVAAVVGMPTIIWGGWQLIGIGISCIVFAFLYTTLLSRKALGDVLVLVFFGIVPVCTTYYIQMHCITFECLMLSIGMGLVTDNLLIVNNYRDRDTDILHDKKTLVTFIGERATEHLYLMLGLAGFLCTLPLTNNHQLSVFLCLIYIFHHTKTWRMMVNIKQGKSLNIVLAHTAQGILLFALTISIGILLK